MHTSRIMTCRVYLIIGHGCFEGMIRRRKREMEPLFSLPVAVIKSVADQFLRLLHRFKKIDAFIGLRIEILFCGIHISDVARGFMKKVYLWDTGNPQGRRIDKDRDIFPF